MLDWIRSNPGVVTGIVGALLALLLGGTARFWAYLKQLAGEQGANRIMAQAIEAVGENAKARVRNSGAAASADRKIAVAFEEAVEQIKTKVRVSAAMAPEQTHQAVGDAVATVDKKKATPLKVLGWLGRAAWWAMKKKAGL